MVDIAELAATADRRLNIGCGQMPMSYWTNLDEDPEVEAHIYQHVPPIPATDECLDEIYAGHVLEHMTYEEAQEFFAEAYRVLVPGGKLGVVVPDTREIMRHWLEGSHYAVEGPRRVWWRMGKLEDVCAYFLFSTVQESRHLWAWDIESLARAFEAAGFHDLTEIDRYADERIPQGAWYQCGIDGWKA